MLANAPGHPFYELLNAVLEAKGFDGFVEDLCANFYSKPSSRPPLRPGFYFRALLIGYFAGIGAEHALVWRLADSLTLRRFVGIALDEATPDYLTISRTRQLIDLDTHAAVFAWVLEVMGQRGLLVGKNIAIEATTLEANAAMHSIVRRNCGARSFEEFLASLATASGVQTPTREELAQLHGKRKKRASGRDVSIQDSKPPGDEAAPMAKAEDGRRPLDHQAEDAVDRESGAAAEPVAHETGSRPGYAEIYGAEDKLDKHRRVIEEAHLAAVLQLSRMTRTNERAMLDYALAEAMRLLDSRYGFIGYISEDESMMSILAWSRDAMHDCAMREKPIDYPISAAGIWAEPLLTRAPHFFNDYSQAHPRKHGIPQGHVEIRRYLGVPIFEGERVAMIAAVANKQEPYEEFDAAILSALMTHAWHVTQRNRDEEQLRIAAAAFESNQGVSVTSSDNVILRVNRAFTDITGYSIEEAVGQKLNMLASGRHDEAFETRMWEEIRLKGAWQGEVWYRRKNGEVFPAGLTITAVMGDAGEVTHTVATLTDITERKAAEDKIEQLAFYDSLTGLPNRRLLFDRLQQALASSKRNQRHGALMFIDLDNFKTLNDTRGHAAGDLLLQQVAERLTACTREADTVARLGGDEFVVMLEQLSEDPVEAAAQIKTVGEKILEALHQPNTLVPQEHICTASIGATLFGEAQDRVDDLVKQADIAMYRAKTEGRNTLRFFFPHLQVAIKDRATLEADMRQGLKENRFLLHYQPQVDDEGRLIGVEALLRWQHRERGLVSPAEFIPMAEETGLILPLGNWVLETACARIKDWASRPETAHLTMAVNVSARQFRQEDFVEQVMAVLDHTGTDPRNIKLELTESMLVDNVADIIVKMNALKARGLSFSLDDFGTGYSSLFHLKRLPLSQLKIDRSFVGDVFVDAHDATIVRTIVALGQSLNLSVIAEGVETEAQRQFLSSLGCQAYQGFLFSRPVPAEEFVQFLNRKDHL